MSGNSDPATLAVTVPVFNEAGSLPEFHRQLTAVLEELDLDWSILFVDDGSTDGSTETLERLAAGETRVGYLSLTRNFGKEAALLAGLDHVDADLVIMMDADLQHPPEMIPELVSAHQGGADMVTVVRASRGDEGWAKRFGVRAFYGLMDRFSEVPVTPDGSDFRLVTRPVADAFRELRESHRFAKGLFAWLGFRHVTLDYHPATRVAGTSKWSTPRLLGFGWGGLASFSIAPLRLVTLAGFAVALAAFAYGVFIVVKTVLFGDPVAGFPTIAVLVLFLAGLQLLALGVIGEYVGRTYQQVKRRPPYLVARTGGMLSGGPGRTPRS